MRSAGTVEDRLSAVRRMADEIEHRGPDDSGAWADESSGVALGFRRLSIIDLTIAGHQPMISGDGRFVITFNGEIYNHRLLRSELEDDGIVFRGRSDTEVLCNGFSRWGVLRTLKRIDGMFAIAAWDRLTGALSLARDRMGIKPLFVHSQPGFVSFGSELKALAVGPRFSRTLSPAAVDTFLRHLYVPAPASIYADTYKVLPGQLIQLSSPDDDVCSGEHYWSLPRSPASNSLMAINSEVEGVERLDSALRHSVATHLESDVPIGAFLSGGIDSTAVVAMSAAVAAQSIRTFSVAFDEAEHDESAQAAAIARHLGTKHTEIRLTSDEAFKLIPSLPDVYDEPFADPSQLATILVCSAARQHVTVALSGDGGDELFAGYNRYRHASTIARSFLGLPEIVRHAVAGAITRPSAKAWDRSYSLMADLLPGSPQRLFGEKMMKFGQALRADSEADLYRRLVSVWRPETRLLTKAADPFTSIDSFSLSDFERSDDTLLNRMLRADQLGSLADDQLAKVDRASMTVGLEVRVPLLDHHVVEHSWSVPSSLKLHNGVSKYLLRKVVYQYVPESLLDRPKMGFSVPIGPWLRGPLKYWAEHLLREPMPELDALLLERPTREAWRRLQNGDDSRALALWAMLVLRQWYMRWVM